MFKICKPKLFIFLFSCNIITILLRKQYNQYKPMHKILQLFHTSVWLPCEIPHHFKILTCFFMKIMIFLLT